MIKQQGKNILLVFGVVLVMITIQTASAIAYDWDALIQNNKDAKKDDLKARLHLAIAYANTGKMFQSIDEFSYIGSQDYESFGKKMIKESEDTLKKKPNDILAHNILAFTNFAFGKYDKSRASFQKLVTLEPKNIWAHNFLGFALGKEGKLDEAIETLKNALKIDSENEYTHFLLGLAYWEKGQKLKAISEFLKAPNVYKDYLSAS